MFPSSYLAEVWICSPMSLHDGVGKLSQKLWLFVTGCRFVIEITSLGQFYYNVFLSIVSKGQFSCSKSKIRLSKIFYGHSEH